MLGVVAWGVTASREWREKNSAGPGPLEFIGGYEFGHDNQ
jgi:hypothetical protein